MGHIIQYPQWIAAVLLTVYAFIAAPVQLWHHHPAEENTRTEQSSGKQPVITKANISGEDCPVCSHRYAAYTDYYYTIAIAPPTVYISTQPDGSTSLWQVFVLHCSNKGPPHSA